MNCYICKAPTLSVSRKQRLAGGRCRECDAANSRDRYGRNRETIIPAMRERALIRKYGISVAERDAMSLAQNGRCKICDGEPDGRWKKLHVDHCHKTGKVRGLLCSKCNSGIGYFRDNPVTLTAAIAYLKGHAQ